MQPFTFIFRCGGYICVMMPIKYIRPLFYILLLIPVQLIARTDSLDIKIGQMIMVGLKGHSVHSQSDIVQDIRNNIIGGILLFEYNINPVNSIDNLKKLNGQLQQYANIPLFISIDQEGGQVNRLKKKYGFPAMSSAKVVGLRNNDSVSHQFGLTIAKSLKRTSFNLNYAPVVDIDNPNCPVLGKLGRCFSANPKVIARIADIIIEEHKGQDIISCVKHFPGHGSSNKDSHLGLVDITESWSTKELYPYKNLIENNAVEMVMIGHLVNKQLDDSGLPATLSKKMVTDVLRGQLKYNGVVITDDMQMHAISKYYGLEKSILLSINAGVDIVMFSNNIAGAKDYNPSNIHRVIRKLVDSGQISKARIEESFQRIMKLKSNL